MVMFDIPQRLLLILVAASAASCRAAVELPLRESGRIVVLGDSLAVSPSPGEGFPAALQDRLRAEGLSWSVVNAGVRGDTTAGGLRRIDGLLAANRPDVLILALGANDGLRKMDVVQMSDNLGEMIRRAKAGGADVLLCGMELPPLNVFSYGKQFRNVFSDLADDHNVVFVPFLLEGVAMNRQMNGADSIHPNAAGARRIAETVWPYLIDVIRE
jgi:acyl-CoA thioesterase-1